MLTNEQAQQVAEVMLEPDLFPEVRQEVTRTLLDYFKELLYREPHKPIPTVRRMW
jgi:hypothetical protein